MIWPTGLGDFLIKRVPISESFGVEPNDSTPSARPGGYLVSRSPTFLAPGQGYLATGPARPLLWRDARPIATTAVVLKLEDNRVTPRDLAKAPEAEEAETRTSESKPPESGPLPGSDDVQVLTAQEPPEADIPPEEELARPEPSRRRAIDQKFVNWVTRRMEDTKVEIPFQLPSGTATGEPLAPTERVRVRYRTEP